MRSFLLSIFCMMMLVLSLPAASHATPPNPGDPTPCGSCPTTPIDVKWPKLPLACLPDRAERWKTADEMQPCHCPPPDYCPKMRPIEPKDITFMLTWELLNHTRGDCKVKGNEIPNIEGLIAAGHLFDHEKEMFAAIGPTVKDKCGIDINGGDYWWVNVAVAVENDQNLLDWVNDTLKMPIDLAVRCCDNICPAGMRPVIKEVEVEITRVVGEGTGSPKACEEATAALEKAQKELDDAKKAADDAAKKAKEACEEPTGAPGDACDAAVKKAKDAADMVKIKQTKLEDATDLKTKSCNIPKTVKEKVKVKTVRCEKIQTHSREGCMLEGTEILMADGSSKRVEDVKVGDVVKGNEGPAKVLATTRFTQSEDFFYSINGGQATFTIEHPVLTKGGWKSVDPSITSTKASKTKVIGKLEVGDKILTKDGEVEVKSIEKKKSEGSNVSAYNLKVERDGSFYANGVIIKGFNQMQMHY